MIAQILIALVLIGFLIFGIGTAVDFVTAEGEVDERE